MIKLTVHLFIITYNVLLFFVSIGKGERVRDAGHAKKIVLTGTFYSSNWIESHIVPLAQSSGCVQVYLITLIELNDIVGVKIVHPPSRLVKTIGGVPARLLYFVYYSIKTRPDIVGGFHLLFNGLIAKLTAALIGCKSMYFCVGGPAEILDGGINSENKLFGKQTRPDITIENKLLNIIKKFDLIVTMGTSAKSFFRERGVKTKIEVISGGINSEKFDLAKQEKAYDFVFVGRLAKIKRIDILLNALAVLNRGNKKYSLVIVGDGEMRDEMTRLTQALNMESQVSFVGSRTDIENWLNKSKVFMMTSDSEGLSLALMEAMMCSLPAIVSNVGDLGDIVTDGENGFLIGSRKPSDFAEKMKLILESESDYDKYSRNARASAERYKIENTVNRWDNILRSID